MFLLQIKGPRVFVVNNYPISMFIYVSIHVFFSIDV